MIEKIIEKAKQENKKIYIYAHRYPDGDAVSSSCAVAEYLKNQGIDAKYIITNEIRTFNQIVGETPVSEEVDEDAISVILDTSTLSYAENRLFDSSSKENIYVIDHHAKIKGGTCIEEELGIPSENVIRDSSASSVCEMLVNELDQEKITPEIANMLTLGLLTDTAKLKFLKENTLLNLSRLIELGADYKQVIEACTRKSNLREEVGIAKMMLNIKKFPIGDTFGMILSVDKKEVDDLGKIYGVRSPQKKIFKMSDIENCSFTCMTVENKPGEYDAEFRNSVAYGNFDVLQLATSYGGGGHHGASGCVVKASVMHSQKELEEQIEEKAKMLYEEKATGLPKIELNEQDKELASILDKTNRLAEGITPEVLAKVDSLVKTGSNYDYVFKKFRSFEKFMLQNELLSRIPDFVYTKKDPRVKINLSEKSVENLMKKYNVSREDVLSAIEVFSNIDVESAAIFLPDGSKSFIDSNGKIIIKEAEMKKDFSNDVPI